MSRNHSKTWALASERVRAWAQCLRHKQKRQIPVSVMLHSSLDLMLASYQFRASMSLGPPTSL